MRQANNNKFVRPSSSAGEEESVRAACRLLVPLLEPLLVEVLVRTMPLFQDEDSRAVLFETEREGIKRNL